MVRPKSTPGVTKDSISIRTRSKVDSRTQNDITDPSTSRLVGGLRQLQSKLVSVDLILEVHDGRIPFSGRNPKFTEVINVRPHILVLNKIDLADLRKKEAVEAKLRETGVQHVVYTNCKQQIHHTLNRVLLPMISNMIDGGPRYHRADELDYNLLVIGVPNTGKSSLINAMRRLHLKRGRSRVAPVGGVAGVTRSVMERVKICDNPPIYMYDSPGILTPSVQDVEEGMKLAVCGAMKDSLVGEDFIADYLLFWLNKHRKFSYVRHFNLPCATDDILELLASIAQQHNLTQKQRSQEGQGYVIRPNFTRAAQIFLKAFREGELGRVLLDQDLIASGETQSRR